MDNKELYKRTFSRLYASRDVDLEDIVKRGKRRQRAKTQTVVIYVVMVTLIVIKGTKNVSLYMINYVQQKTMAKGK